MGPAAYHPDPPPALKSHGQPVKPLQRGRQVGEQTPDTTSVLLVSVGCTQPGITGPQSSRDALRAYQVSPLGAPWGQTGWRADLGKIGSTTWLANNLPRQRTLGSFYEHVRGKFQRTQPCVQFIFGGRGGGLCFNDLLQKWPLGATEEERQGHCRQNKLGSPDGSRPSTAPPSPCLACALFIWLSLES